MTDPVKGRTEAGRRREERALRTRRRIVETATVRFLQHGYSATSVESIAADAGVATATVYQAFGTKAAVLARALDEAIVGDGDDTPLLERGWVAVAREERDPHRRLALVVDGAAAAAARTSALKAMARDAAAIEPAIRELLESDHTRRLLTQRALVEIVLGRSPTEDEVAVFYLLVNSPTQLLATEQLGWDEVRWREWLCDVLAQQYLVGEHVSDSEA